MELASICRWAHRARRYRNSVEIASRWSGEWSWCASLTRAIASSPVSRRADGQDEDCEEATTPAASERTLGTGFPGGTYLQVFYVADVEAAGPSIDGELHGNLDEADFLAVFPLVGKGRARLIGTVRDERADRLDRHSFPLDEMQHDTGIEFATTGCPSASHRAP